jgi:hypothetical protein
MVTWRCCESPKSPPIITVAPSVLKGVSLLVSWHKFDRICRKNMQYLYLEIKFIKTRFKYLYNDINFVTWILIYFYIFCQNCFSRCENDTYCGTEGVINMDCHLVKHEKKDLRIQVWLSSKYLLLVYRIKNNCVEWRLQERQVIVKPPRKYGTSNLICSFSKK